MKPEQSKEFGPLAPHTYGAPSLDEATDIRADAPPLAGMLTGGVVLPDGLPVLPEPPLFPVLPLFPELLGLVVVPEPLELAAGRLTLSPVSLAMVWTPTRPSEVSPLRDWKFLTAFSVASP